MLTSESKRISKQEREATKNSLNLYRELYKENRQKRDNGEVNTKICLKRANNLEKITS